jgi:putative tryptophan/tyrosine transport system substrate-binding protein
MHFDQMKRREFITLLGATAFAWPLAVRAQQPVRMRRVGLLMGFPEGDLDGRASAEVFQRGLQELGWTEGRNIRIDTRWAGADPDKARIFAKELIGLTPDVIVPSTNLVTAILQQETRAIPIVFVFVGDPVGSGFVASQARPGGNLTGFAIFEPAIGGKWLEILKEIAPQVSRVAVILHPETPVNVGFLRAAEAAAPSFGVKLIALGVHTDAEIERAIGEFAAGSKGGLIVAPHAVTQQHRRLIIGLAARYHLPAIYGPRHFAMSGGLISYGPNPIEPFRKGPSYVDHILKGAKPTDLPVQFPTKYELVINLKTAQALDLEVPPTLLGRADEVIE